MIDRGRGEDALILAADSPSPPVNPDDFLPTGTFNPADHHADDLINLLAWCVTAAAVGGLIIVGTRLALQLNRGEPGEGAAHFRGLMFVLGACVIGSSAGPLVAFLL